MSHSPLPWIDGNDEEDNWLVIDSLGQEIAKVHKGASDDSKDIALADAQLIVNAVNHHAKLVAFAESVVRYAGNIGDDYLCEQAREVLASVRGQSS